VPQLVQGQDLLELFVEDPVYPPAQLMFRHRLSVVGVRWIRVGEEPYFSCFDFGMSRILMIHVLRTSPRSRLIGRVDSIRLDGGGRLRFFELLKHFVQQSTKLLKLGVPNPA
jgi:hypothetical protein